jgi:uncharacterized protein (TIGR03083 family)
MIESFVVAANLPPMDPTGAADVGHAEGHAALALLRQLGQKDWRRPTDCTEWDVRALVSHLVGQCEDGILLSTLLRRQIQARRRYRDRAGVDAHMAVQIDDHRAAGGPDLVDRFATLWPRAVQARQRRPAALRSISINLGIPGTPRVRLAYLLDVIYNRDLWMHRVDLARATDQPFVAGQHDRHVVAQAVRDLAQRWQQAPLALELTGPAGGSWLVGDGEPAAAVRVDAIAYMRALAGRDTNVGVSFHSGDATVLASIRQARIPF